MLKIIWTYCLIIIEEIRLTGVTEKLKKNVFILVFGKKCLKIILSWSTFKLFIYAQMLKKLAVYIS